MARVGVSVTNGALPAAAGLEAVNGVRRHVRASILSSEPVLTAGVPERRIAVAASILVVDDNAAKRIAVRAMLAPLGHSVVEVDSGREALRAVMGGTFALILMDVRMPGMDGFETARLIRQRPESELTPIIFITAFGCDEAETADAYASGAVDFVFTPVVPDVLRAKVTVFVNLFMASEQLQASYLAENGGLSNSGIESGLCGRTASCGRASR